MGAEVLKGIEAKPEFEAAMIELSARWTFVQYMAFVWGHNTTTSGVDEPVG